MTQNVSEISVFVGNNVFGKKSITETLCGLFHFFSLSSVLVSLLPSSCLPTDEFLDWRGKICINRISYFIWQYFYYFSKQA